MHRSYWRERSPTFKGAWYGCTTTKRGFDHYYRITIKVSQVVKCGSARGPRLVVNRLPARSKPPPGWVGPSCHGAPPPKGATIMAYVTDRKESGG